MYTEVIFNFEVMPSSLLTQFWGSDILRYKESRIGCKERNGNYTKEHGSELLSYNPQTPATYFNIIQLPEEAPLK